MYSIVVPTYNGASTIGAALDTLLAQRTDVPYEIIVVDNNSSDITRDVIADYGSQVCYVFEKEQGISAARNTGISVATGDIIAFIDDDCVPGPGWLEALAATYQKHSDAWGVGGKITLALPDPCPDWFRCSPRYGFDGFFGRQDFGDGIQQVDYPEVLYGGNFSARAEVFARLGGFDVRLGVMASSRIAGEDLEFCRRVQHAGGTLYYCGTASVRHAVRTARLTKKYFRHGVYWGARTEMHPLVRNRLSLTEAARELLIVGKEGAKMLAAYALGPSRMAFPYELSVRKHLASLWYGWLRHEGSRISTTYPRVTHVSEKP